MPGAVSRAVTSDALMPSMNSSVSTACPTKRRVVAQHVHGAVAAEVRAKRSMLRASFVRSISRQIERRNSSAIARGGENCRLGDVVLQQAGEARQDVEVARDLRLEVRAADLHHDLGAVQAASRTVHLRDRRRGERRHVEAREQLSPRTPNCCSLALRVLAGNGGTRSRRRRSSSTRLMGMRSGRREDFCPSLDVGPSSERYADALFGGEGFRRRISVTLAPAPHAPICRPRGRCGTRSPQLYLDEHRGDPRRRCRL